MQHSNARPAPILLHCCPPVHCSVASSVACSVASNVASSVACSVASSVVSSVVCSNTFALLPAAVDRCQCIRDAALPASLQKPLN